KLNHTLSTCDSEEYLFLGGDFNCTENPVLDRNHQEPHAASKSALIRLTESFELCDVWRHFYPGQRQYTWQWWDVGKVKIKQLCLQYTFNVTKDMARSLRALEREVVELQGLADSTGEREHVEVFKSKSSALSDLLGFSAQGALVRSRFQNIVKMDAPSHFFFGLKRKNGQRRLMHSLRSNAGQLLQESADIRQCAVEFYKELYRTEFQAEPEVAQSFYEGLPNVPEEDHAELEAELSAQELQEALQSDDLLSVLRDSLSNGRLPLSCRRAVLTLLPKKGDLQEIKNWRPVSLLCTDYKLLSKVLATRLRKVMEHVIHVDQTYCVPSRLITDNVTLIRDVLDLSGSLGCELGLISLDQEKAFDRVEHQYLWQTLEAFGFSSGLIAKIQVLYRDIESVLKINGSLCAPFEAQRGVRQGCSLSRMLYSLAIELFLHRLRLACTDPPVNLLSRVQALMVDFFWDRMHWVPQSVLFLPKEEGGHGLVHLASRGAAFRLRFVQRFLTGPADLVWRPVARALLERCGGLGLAESLFLMDLKGLRLNNLSGFYGGLFKVWGLLKKERPECCGSLFWLLREPVVRGSRFVCGVGPSLQQRLCEERILMLGQVVEVCGPRLDNAAGLASRLSLRSVRVVSLLLQSWKQQLSQSELALIAAHCNGLKSPNDNDSFPEMQCFPDLSCEVLNQSRLQERVDTRWRAHLGLTEAQRPEWRALYKPPLTKRGGDLQWRILHA
ncbi:hypothetical protein JOQ06_020193, partial [Pogonophryne albipinna]